MDSISITQKGKKQKERIRLKIGCDGNIKPNINDGDVKQKGKNSWYVLGTIGEIGFTIAIPIAGGVLVGSYLDTKWNMYPRLTLSLLMTGIFLSMVNVYFLIRDITKNTKDE